MANKIKLITMLVNMDYYANDFLKGQQKGKNIKNFILNTANA